jgi:hypothetical protein
VDENPYQSPLADLEAVGVLSGKQADLRAVAVYQKGILVCILVYVFSYIAGIVGSIVVDIPIQGHQVIMLIMMVGVLGSTIGGLIFVFLLALKVYGKTLGIFLGLLSFLPCIGLLVLLAVNGKATSILKQNGHRVGLLGADLSKFSE